MNLSRMELADCGSVEKIAEAIFRQISDIPIPVPIEEIARALNIRDIRHLETTGFEGGLITDAERAEGVILVNAANRLERRRFTLGHELGHFLCPWHEPQANNGFLCSSSDMRNMVAPKGDRRAEMEIQANRFSVLMLMPAVHITRDLKRKAGVDIAHILALATSYQTSKEATARRYVELRGERCAAIVSRNGKIERIYRHQDFPFVDVQPGHPVPSAAVTARANPPFGEPSDCEEIDGSTWLATKLGRRLPPLYEQVLLQQGGYRLTLLSFDEDEIEDAEEEEDLQESWHVRFREKR